MTKVTFAFSGKSIRVRDLDIAPMNLVVPHLYNVGECSLKGEVVVLKDWEALSSIRLRCRIYSLEEAAAIIMWLLETNSHATLFVPHYTLTLYHDVTGWVLWGYHYYGSPPDEPESYFPPNSRVVRELPHQ